MTEVTEKPAFANIAMALASAQLNMGKALKDSANPAFKSKYADLASVMDACMSALNSAGIAVIQPTTDDDHGRYVETIFIHGASGEVLKCRVPLIVNKNDMQGYGSAVTYARRYGLMSMAGIAPEDDDGNAAAKAAPKEQEAPKEAPYDPKPAVTAIDAALTGKALLDALNSQDCDNAHPIIIAARRDKLSDLVKGAQSIAALDQFAKAFAADWEYVKADADARRNELNA